MSDGEPFKCPCYCINFRHAANILTKYYDRGFEKVNLTANQFFLLISIHHFKSCNKSELARYTRLERTTIVRNLSVLLKKNFIEEVLGNTKRNKMIQLTEEGIQAVREGSKIWNQLQINVRESFGQEKIGVLREVLGDIEILEEKL